MIANLANVGVHPVDERRDDLPGIGRVAVPLPAHVAPILEEPGKLVPLDRAPAQHLGQPALALTTPHFHLEEPVLRRHESLRKEQIVDRLGINVGYSPPVPPHFDRRVEAGHSELPVDLSQPSLGRVEQALG